VTTSDIIDAETLPSYPFPDTFNPVAPPTVAEIGRREPAIRVRFGPGQLPVWLILRHGPARAMLADARFSRARTLEFGPRLMGAQVPDPHSLLWLDPPAHTRIRTLVAAAFSTRRIEQLRPWVAGTARAQVAEMVAGGSPADLRDALAFRLPIEVICHLLGVPDVDRARVRGWSEALFRFQTDRAGAGAALQALLGYMDTIIAEREASVADGTPPDSLLDAFITSRDADDRLSHAELRSLALTILIGGFETTAGVIANGVTTLLTDRSRWELLVGDRTLLPNAVEELLRFHPLSMTFPRVATEDVDLGELTVRAGEVVIAPFAALNRDERLYEEPDVLDLRREPAANLTFGHGVHHCLGAHLARVELTEALGALLEALPGLRLAVPAEELEYDMRAPIGRPTHLPVSWE
jgi:cytochrome P450